MVLIQMGVRAVCVDMTQDQLNVLNRAKQAARREREKLGIDQTPPNPQSNIDARKTMASAMRVLHHDSLRSIDKLILDVQTRGRWSTMWAVLFGNDKHVLRRRVLATMLVTMQVPQVSETAPSLRNFAFVGQAADEDLLLTQRNQLVLNSLENLPRITGKRLSKPPTKLALVYGAMHMNGIERQLIEEYGFKRTNSEWVPVWDLSKKSID